MPGNVRGVYASVQEALRASLASGKEPVLRGRHVRQKSLDPWALAAELGLYARYDEERDWYVFKPGE